MCICAPALVAGQSGIEGFIRKDDVGIAEVYVTLHRPASDSVLRSALTDRFGFFRLRFDAGDYELRASRLGYDEVRRPVRLESGGLLRVELELTERALSIAPVTVEGTRQRVAFERTAGQTTRELSQAELKLIPGLMEADVLRAIEVLPGVISTSDFSSAFNVRGGSADQNLITLDGFPVYNPFHLGGLFSVFNGDMVGRAELIAGGFPAQYSGRVSSVLNVESDPGPPGTDLRGGVSLLATRVALSAEAPREWGQDIGLRSMRGRIAGRRSYFDQLFKPVFDFPYHLTDLQAYGEAWTAGGGRLSFTGYTGNDLLNFVGVADFPLKLRWEWGNDLAGLRWLQHLSGGQMVDVHAGITQFGTAILFPEFGDTRFNSRIRQTFVKADVQLPSWPRLDVSVGAEVNRLTYANRAQAGGTVFRAASEDATLAGAYLQGSWRPTSDWL